MSGKMAAGKKPDHALLFKSPLSQTIIKELRRLEKKELKSSRRSA